MNRPAFDFLTHPTLAKQRTARIPVLLSVMVKKIEVVDTANIAALPNMINRDSFINLSFSYSPSSE
jgi:hypothetical protein